MQVLKRKKINSRGFTLIELLIVIIIIGILAAIAFVAYSSATNKANKAAAQSTLSEIQSKLAEYNGNNGNYPLATASPNTVTNVNNWLNAAPGGSNTALATAFTDAKGYTYSTVGPAGCGDTVASGTGAVTAGTACTGYSITVNAANAGGTAITVTN